jgi:RNA polymerase subunit RPABC4/transcription elongation factor Spt4
MSECVECGSVMPPGPGVCPSCGVQKLVVVVNEPVEVSDDLP